MNKYSRSSHNYLFNVWLQMVYRCTKKTHPAWPDYGGRGITVCEGWRCSFERFVDDVGERPSKLFTLDRIDNDKGYEPRNVRWATWKTQARNRRPPREKSGIIRIDGLPLSKFAALHGINHATLKLRYHNGKRGDALIAKDLRTKEINGEVVPK